MPASPRPVLFGLQRSVYTRIARLVLEEKGVPDEHLQRPPFGRIPVLQHGTFVLYETGAIARYIDEARL